MFAPILCSKEMEPIHTAENLRRPSREVLADGIWRSAAAHPFLFTALACLAAAALFLTSDGKLAPAALFGMLVLSCVFIAAFAKLQYDLGKLPRAAVPVVLLVGCLLFAFVYFFMAKQEKNVVFLLPAGLLTAGIALYSLIRTRRLTAGRIVALLFFLGVLLRLCYILYTSIYMRQHDVEGWDGSGHLGYIMQLYQNHELPQGDVREFWQYYHPPFHHLLEAVWVGLMTALGMDLYTTAAEGMQFLTLFYSAICMVICYKLLREFGVKGWALVVSFAVVAFHPTFILLSGSVNNDILSITLMLGAILCTVKWYRNQTVKNILKIALCIGLGMMTKLSAWMVAPGVAIVFLLALLKSRARLKSLIGQMCAFGAVCVPLGLWWSIRNFVSHGVPFAYVPGLGEDSHQYIGNFSVLERLFHFDFTNIYHDIPNMGNINPLMELFKSAMFDELIYSDIPFWPYLLFWSGLLLAAAAFVSMLVVLFRRSESFENELKLLFAVTYVIILACYYLFCFQYPHMCTENARYVVPLIVFGALFIGIFLQGLRDRQAQQSGRSAWAVRICYPAAAGLSGLFAAAASFVYCLMGWVY